MSNNNKPTESEVAFDYHRTEIARLKYFRRWTKILTVASAILLVICAFLLIVAIISGHTESRLTKENDSLKAQIALSKANASSTKTTTSGENLTKGLDTTKLLTQNDVGADQIPDHFIGDRNAKVVVIEYADFACSACQNSYATTKEIHQTYSGQVLFIQRSFSLDFPNSEIALSAAEAAYLVGGETAYHQMTELLYQDQSWSHSEISEVAAMAKLSEYASEIGLCTESFAKILSERANNGILTKIARDRESGLLAGIRATPSRIVNGQKVEGGSASALRSAIDAALESAQ